MFYQNTLLQFVAIGFVGIGFFGGGLYLTFVFWTIAFVLFTWDFVLGKKAVKKQKVKFLTNFQNDSLCIHKQTPNFVYMILEKDEQRMKIQPVWSHGKPQINREPILVNSDAILPFNEKAFLEFC